MLAMVVSAHAQTIVLDIGHTRDKPGVISAIGKPEYKFNSDVVFILGDRLKKKGYTVHVIRDIERLQSRGGKVDSYLPDVLISIHHDSVQQKYLTGSWIYNNEPYPYTDEIRGYSLFVNTKNPKSTVLALKIAQNIQKFGFVASQHHKEKIPGEGRKPIDDVLGVYEFNELVLLRSVYKPAAVLIECGVITNRHEVFFISDIHVMVMMVDAIIHGVDEYFGK
jgi:N-acetylmuramoyl-L-alanine amidase